MHDAAGTAGAAGTHGAAGGVRRTRREVTCGLLASAVAAALTPVVAASRPPRPDADPFSGPGDTAFEETYQGRHIRGVRTPRRGAAGTGEWYVTVDGRPLHLMRRADGTWLSMVDHYQSYRTPLEAARAAVDELGPGGRLRDDIAPGPMGGTTGGRKGGVHGGVHA
ncbi:tyrosinase family oxidase copper chaperone [Streptomyces anandii]|uniref:tyrosinase family oxidase copper chaperone n=1 Tax=Streptomyces anandii TaxID=285454 RepID=UPI0037005FC8